MSDYHHDFAERLEDELRAEGFTIPPPRAADLPDGTVVAEQVTAWLKDPDDGWLSTHSFDPASEDEIDVRLATGARVLRYGYNGEAASRE